MGQGRHRLVRLASRLLLLLILGVCSFARVCVRVYADCVCVCVCVCVPGLLVQGVGVLWLLVQLNFSLL